VRSTPDQKAAKNKKWEYGYANHEFQSTETISALPIEQSRYCLPNSGFAFNEIMPGITLCQEGLLFQLAFTAALAYKSSTGLRKA
jgi:hypothetical protein